MNNFFRGVLKNLGLSWDSVNSIPTLSQLGMFHTFADNLGSWKLEVQFMLKCDSPQARVGTNLHPKGLQTQSAAAGGRQTMMMIMVMMMNMMMMMMLMRTMMIVIH